MDVGAFAEAPMLETSRLVLRAHRIGDFDALAALWADPEVVRHITGRPSTREESWSRLLRYAGHWRLLGFGYWAVEERATGRFIGNVGLADHKRLIEPSLDGVPEVGWVIAPAAHGEGYASEAVGAALTWADLNLTEPETGCIIAPDNATSLRVAEKAGFREVARTTYGGKDTIMFRRVRRRADSSHAGAAV
jgi:RimJ/RimL family protein N-acetyltransferase